jgi:methylated-DNA-[protein]-cysteine S-methyltransferase
MRTEMNQTNHPPRETLRFDTGIGPVLAIAVGARLRRLSLVSQRHLPNNLDLSGEVGPTVSAARRELLEYLDGARREFDVELDPVGTAFQLEVWAELTRIPYGETVSYAQLAASIGRPSAVRAVAMANARNPFTVLVPCHRVVGRDGSLTGYAGGLDVKRRLLELEGVAISGDHVAARRAA